MTQHGTGRKTGREAIQVNNSILADIPLKSEHIAAIRAALSRDLRQRFGDVWWAPGMPRERHWDSLNRFYRAEMKSRGYTRERWDSGWFIRHGIDPQVIQIGARFGTRTVTDVTECRVTLRCDCQKVTTLDIEYFCRTLPMVCRGHVWNVDRPRKKSKEFPPYTVIRISGYDDMTEECDSVAT